MGNYIDPEKKKSVMYMELLQYIGGSVDRLTNAVVELDKTIKNRSNEATGIVLALQPLSNLAEIAAPFLKEILSNEFVSAISARNQELEKNNVSLQLELKELRERLKLDPEVLDRLRGVVRPGDEEVMDDGSPLA